MAREEAGQGWVARLDLRFERRGDRTVLVQSRHQGPLRVQRPFYPEPDGTCHVYLLHPPGGVVGGDRLSLNVGVEPGAKVLLTTPAAGKFYRSPAEPGRQHQHFRIAAGASLEWLPQENILFEGARVEAETRVELEQDATFIGWDIVCLGRPAAGEGYTQGHGRLRFEVWREGKPIWIERTRFQGGDAILQAPWGMAGFPVIATLVCVGSPPGLGDAVRAAMVSEGDELFGVTQLSEVLICRYLGYHGWRARQGLLKAWEVLRPAVLLREACVPRIWYF